MTDKETIRAEIERRIEKHKQWVGNSFGCAEERIEELEDILSVIDSMPEEPVSEDLEEAAKKECRGLADPQQILDCYCQFIRGAKWQKQQLMKSAVKGIVHHFGDDEIAAIHYNDPKGVPMSYFVSSDSLKAGDKVKLIIFKED